MSFEPANESIPRAKIFLYGESGVGKTTFAMRWSEIGGKIAVIDLEDSTKRYDKEFSFHRWNPTPTRIEEVLDAIDFLSTQKHEFTTLLIDPITLVYDMVLSYWESKFLETRKEKVGHHKDHYEIQPKDWKLIKTYWRRLFYRLRKMDMNVICTARSKTLYDDTSGSSMMKSIGKTFDSEKGTDYEMDSVFQMYRIKETSQYMMRVDKHRSFKNPMPETIDITGGAMDLFIKHFGDSITRKAVPIVYVTQEKQEKIKRLLVMLGVTEEKERAALKKWGVSTLADLESSSADEIIATLEEKVSKLTPF